MRTTLAGLVCLGTAVAPAAAFGVATDGASSALAEETPVLVIKDDRVLTVNGLTPSTRSSGLHYVHDGQAGSTRLIAVDDSGDTQATLRVKGARNVSWEDLDSGPDHHLYIADVGNEELDRGRVVIYRTQEPRRPAQARTMSAERYTFRYADGRHHSTAIMVAPGSGRVFVVTHDDAGGAVYRAPRRLSAHRANPLERVGEAPAGVTGASFAPDGTSYVLGTADTVFRYDRGGELLASVDKPDAARSGKALVVRPSGEEALLGTTAAAPSPVYSLALAAAPAGEAVSAPSASLLTSPQGEFTDPQTQIGIRWTPVDARSVRGYRFGYVTTDARENDKQWTSPVLAEGSAPRPFVFTTLVPGVTYDVFVEAVTHRGRSFRTTLRATTAEQDRAPAGPTKVAVSNLASTTMTVTWQPPTDAGTSAVDGYQVGWGTWDSALLPATTRSMDLTNFSPDTEYTLRVRAHNATGYGPWSTVTVKTPSAPTAPSGGSDSSGLLGLPHRVTGVYWTNWNSWIPITDLPTSYNTIYLFAAPRGGAEGGVTWNWSSPTGAQIDRVRGRGQRVILSTGGAGNGINFHSRYVSQNFVDSIVAINRQFGGTLANPKIDGVDFNTFEAEAIPNTTEYLWMFAELKRRFGSNFIITSPPAPWKHQDKDMIRQAMAQGLMDFAAPQYYDGPGLSDPSYITANVREWVRDVAGGQARRIAPGFGMESLPNYSTTAEIRSAWNTVEQEFPGIRGAFVWQHRTDYDRNWTFASNINPLVLD